MTPPHPSDIDTAAGEHDAVRAVLDATREDGERRLVVWQPARQVAFGRRDRTSDGYDEALSLAEEAGYATTVRNVGGHAVVHAGATVAFGVTLPVDGVRSGVRERYDEAVCALRDALASVGVEAQCDEPEATFCPGEASLCTDAGKVAGVAQRVTRESALVSGAVVVGNPVETARALGSVYGALGLGFDPASVGSIDARQDEVAEAVSETLTDTYGVESDP